MNWYAIQTNARSEWLAAKRLKDQGYEVLYLHYKDTVRHARRITNVLKPYFPRYLFAKGQGVYNINTTQGVSSVVYGGGEPLTVPGNVIEELQSRANPDGLVDLEPDEKEARRRFKKGDEVLVEDGPFTGFLAVVSLDAGKSVRVWLNMFKGRVDVDLPPHVISPVRRSVAE